MSGGGLRLPAATASPGRRFMPLAHGLKGTSRISQDEDE